MTDPQTAADAAEVAEAVECVQTYLNGFDRVAEAHGGQGYVFSPEDVVLADAMRTLLKERTRMAAELEQMEDQRDQTRYQLVGAQARIDYFESRAGAVHTVALLESELGRVKAELEQVRGERDADAERIEYATDLLIALARTSPCLQEKGGCITHDRYLPEGSDCPHGLARAFLAGAKAHRSAETTATRPADGKRTPEQWCAEYGIDIADPDGWRNAGDPAWDEPITLPDFLRRAAVSTTRGLTPDLWNRLNREAHEAADAERSDAEGAGKGPESHAEAPGRDTRPPA